MPRSDPLAASPGPRPPWRAVGLLTAGVILAHVALLGLLPASFGTRPSPLADRFITRTIVIAPPEPPVAAPAEAAAQPAQAARPRAAPAARPRPRPRPALTAAPPSAPVPPADAPPAVVELVQPVPEAPETTPAPPVAPTASADPLQPPTPDATAPAAAGPGPAGGDGAAPGGAGAQGAGAGSAGAAPLEGQLAGSTALQIPGSVRLAFAVTGQQGTSPMQGVFGELAWLQDGRQYDARLSLTFLFRTIRSQRSTGTIGPTGIEPTRFADIRRTEVAAHFVRDQGTIVFSSNTPSVPLLPGAQDRLSIMMQLGALLAGDPGRYPGGAAVSIQTVGPKDAEIWTFSVEGEERLAVPAGEFAVRKLTRNPRKPFDDKVELWLASEIGYLPVRIKLSQPNGDFADFQLRERLAPN